MKVKYYVSYHVIYKNNQTLSSDILTIDIQKMFDSNYYIIKSLIQEAKNTFVKSGIEYADLAVSIINFWELGPEFSDDLINVLKTMSSLDIPRLSKIIINHAWDLSQVIPIIKTELISRDYSELDIKSIISQLVDECLKVRIINEL